MRGEMTHPDTCPTCGAAVRVVGSDEGTMRYQPLTRSETTDALWTWLGEETARANLLELDLARAVETRENANTASVRVELENQRLREALKRITSYISGSEGRDARV